MDEHAELDIIHRDEVHELLDGLPLAREQETLIGVSALQTVYLLGTASKSPSSGAPATSR
jgi:hypothetical protein